MHLFKHFFKMLSKYKTGLIIYGAIFLVMIILSMGSNLFLGESYEQEGKQEAGDKRLTIGYVDESGSELSKGLLNYLSEKNDLTDLKDNKARKGLRFQGGSRI